MLKVVCTIQMYSLISRLSPWWGESGNEVTILNLSLFSEGYEFLDEGEREVEIVDFLIQVKDCMVRRVTIVQLSSLAVESQYHS